MNENRTGEAARICYLSRSLEGNIIINDHHFRRNAFGTRHLGREAEVQPITGVVFDHQQCACLSGDCLDRGEDRVSAWRGEDVSYHGGAEHARSDVSCMRRFMTAASA